MPIEGKTQAGPDETDEDIPFIIGTLGKQRTRQGEPLQFYVATTDYPSGSNRVVATGLPSGATLTHLDSGLARVNWTPVTGQEGAYEVEFSDAQKSLPPQPVPIIVGGYPLSHGFYRVPYGDTIDILVSRDHVTHTPPIKEDWKSLQFGPTKSIPIVAAADGRIRFLDDTNTNCCDTTDCSNCNNSVWIEHNNGEWTKYSHFKTGSVAGRGWTDEDCINEGDTLGWEGDVGFTSGSGALNRFQQQCPGASPVDVTRKCAIHLHWEVRMTATDSDLRVPILCGVGGYIAYAGNTIDGEPCDGIGCPTNFILGAAVVSGSTITVLSADDAITSEQEHIGSTSTAYFAGNRITLEPGFAARTGTYFHAMIKPCEGGTSGCPAP
jgi:murein DD-endopeptidase MepM/ murein hydrolase activator NlpD